MRLCFFVFRFEPYVVLLMVLVFGFACTESESDVDPETYQASIDAWHQERIASLREPEGWLSLAGLYWLHKGDNTFGSAPENDIVFPYENAPARMGTLVVDHGTVELRVRAGVDIVSNGQPVESLIVKSDAGGTPTRLEWGSLVWYVIERGDQLGIRLKDREHPRLEAFEGIPRFPVDRDWRIAAEFQPYDSIKTIPIPTVLGTQSGQSCPGALVFTHRGCTYTLEPLAASAREPFFLIFADSTNGKSTYPSGRFLVVDPPDDDGSTFIDFNRAYNPPCSFSPYATCPLPPPQNTLPFAVTAGERFSGHGSH